MKKKCGDGYLFILDAVSVMYIVECSRMNKVYPSKNEVIEIYTLV